MSFISLFDKHSSNIWQDINFQRKMRLFSSRRKYFIILYICYFKNVKHSCPILQILNYHSALIVCLMLCRWSTKNKSKGQKSKCQEIRFTFIKQQKVLFCQKRHKSNCRKSTMPGMLTHKKIWIRLNSIIADMVGIRVEIHKTS